MSAPPPPIRRSKFTGGIACEKLRKLRRVLLVELQALAAVANFPGTHRDMHRDFIQRHINNINRHDSDTGVFDTPSRRPERVTVAYLLYCSVTQAVRLYWAYRQHQAAEPDDTVGLLEQETALRGVIHDWKMCREHASSLTLGGDMVNGWHIIYPEKGDGDNDGTTETMQLEGTSTMDGVRGDRAEHIFIGDILPPGLETGRVPNDAVDD